MVDPHQSQAALSMGAALAGLSPTELVLRCAAIGDTITPDKLTALLGTAAPRTDVEHDVVAIVLNEHLADHGMDHPVATAEDLAGHRQQIPRPDQSR